MHRVSSRQRLVSWDAFDAAARNESDWDEQVSTLSSDEASSDDGDVKVKVSSPATVVSTASTTLSPSSSTDSLVPRKRKKKHSRKNKKTQSPEFLWPAPHVIPALASEVASSTTTASLSSSRRGSSRSKPIALLTAVLSTDAQLQVLSYLDEQDTRSMMEVNHHFRHLLQTSPHVWKSLAHQRWPFLSEQAPWIDRLHVKQVVAGGNTVNTVDHQPEEELNMSFLLHLAAESKASHIDESIFQPCRQSRHATARRVQQQQGTLRRSLLTTELRTVMLQDGVSTAVQFTGRIGFGDRCIRANQPLPRPHHLTKKQMRSLAKLNKRNFVQRLLRRNAEDSPVWRPFVAPFLLPDDQGALSFTPRLVSYFEVHVLDTQVMSLQTPAVEHPHGLQLDRVRGLSAECVAVGISLADFHLHSRMPGWDALSYGYHGDDGGVFHNNGQMVRQFGPSFGVGDVVGCGIDYRASSIFYTLNGRFLGYAFALKEENLLREWYPTVGVDTNSLVQCNFGTDRPFSFDLQAMIEKDREVLVQTVGPHEL